MSARTFTWQSLFALAGLLVWFAHFSLIYAVNALVCARGLAAREIGGVGLAPLLIALLTMLALAAVFVIWRKATSAQRARSADAAEAPSADVLRYLAAGSALLGAVAIVWQALPILLVRACN